MYQSLDLETSFLLYTGLKLDAYGRLKHIVKKFHQLGISISYDRVMQVRKKGGTGSFKEGGVVVPSNCQRSVFTTATVHNLDVSGRSDMHGTSITLIIHKSKDNMVTLRTRLSLDASEDTPIELGEELSSVPYVHELADDSTLQCIAYTNILSGANNMSNMLVKEFHWHQHVRNIFSNGQEYGQWDLGEIPVTFSEKADSSSMQKHVMTIVKKAITFF